MNVIKYFIAIIITVVSVTAFGQYQVPLYTMGNSGSESAGSNYSLLSVTGQNAIGPASDASYKAYLGLLAPLRYVLTDAEIRQLAFTQLFQNYPNPFREKTAIPFEMARQGKVTLTVFNVLGQPVTILIDKQMPPGKHVVEFDAENISPGLFFYTIRVGDFQATKNMVLTK